jgi:hypothetical protein
VTALGSAATIEAQQSQQRLTRHRTRKDVAADDHEIHVRRVHLLEHRVKSGKVPVNVAEHRDAPDVRLHEPHSTVVSRIAAVARCDRVFVNSGAFLRGRQLACRCRRAPTM